MYTYEEEVIGAAEAKELFQCEDIDECSSECLNDCDRETSVCINLVGSYECKCKKGYYYHLTNETLSDDMGDNEKLMRQNQKCIDVNECLLSEAHYHLCDTNAYCLNLNGTYLCKCQSGFYGNGTFCEGLENLNKNS